MRSGVFFYRARGAVGLFLSRAPGIEKRRHHLRRGLRREAAEALAVAVEHRVHGQAGARVEHKVRILVLHLLQTIALDTLSGEVDLPRVALAMFK